MKKTQIFLIALASLMIGFSFIYVQIHYYHLPTIHPSPIDKEKPLTIIVVAHNDENYVTDLFNSIFRQTYNNYHLVFIDDGSEDHTFSLAQNIIKKQGKENFVTLRRYKQQKGTIARSYKRIALLPNDRIVVHMEGNAYFSHEDVLKKIHHIYHSTDAWIAYGQHQEVLSRKKSSLHLIKSPNLFSNSMRRKYWQSPVVKTFYAGLFKKIHLSDFFFHGDLIDEKFDLAYMFPMLEMAGNHVLCTRDILAFYHNSKRGIKKSACHQSPYQCRRYFRQATPYPQLKKPPYRTSIKKRGQADLVIFSFNSPLQLQGLLESIQYFMTGIHQVSVLYRCSDIAHSLAYDKVKKHFPRIQFIKQSELPNVDFEPLVMQISFGSTQKFSKYILFANDSLIIKDFVDLNKCIALLEKTKGSFFSLSVGRHITHSHNSPIRLPMNLDLSQKMIAWQLNSSEKIWADKFNTNLTLYRKKDIYPFLKKISFTTPSELVKQWNHYIKENIPKFTRRRRIGLGFQYSKAINLAYHKYTEEELFQKFIEGYNLYIEPLFQKQNNAFQLEDDLLFIKRN